MNKLEHLVKERKKRIVSLLKKKRLDTLLLGQIENVRYVSGFRPVMSQWFRDSYLAILSPEGKVTLLVTSGDYERARCLLPWVDEIQMLVGSRRIESISNILRTVGRSQQIGYDSLEASDLRYLENRLPSSTFHLCSTEIDHVRSVKLKEELQLMEQGAKITEQAISLALDSAKPGIKECELSSRAEALARERGAEAVSWSFATFSGEHAGLMYRHDTTKKIKEGEFLILGYATIYEGYNTDITATTVVGGTARRTQKEIFGAVYHAYNICMDSAKPGTKTLDLSKLAASVIAQHGIKARNSFVSFQPLIHGLGMNVYEPPFSPDPGYREPNQTLQEGNVFAIEPAVAFFDKPSLGGVRIGETVVLTRSGVKVIGKLPDSMMSIFSK
ncbi:MAG: M24 family metallopeptidase [Nitrososphaerales archaeon]